MKFRESGMPPVDMWDTFFNPVDVLDKMGISSNIDLLIDIGCGYGTFIFPAASVVKRIIGLDIDVLMIDHCRKVIKERNITNVELMLDDVAISSYDAYKENADYVTLFNMLHCEEPVKLLRKAKSLLKSDGRIGVIHWKYEKTPRGPSMDIRPKPEQVIEWAASIELKLDTQVDLPPHHYGLVFKN